MSLLADAEKISIFPFFESASANNIPCLRRKLGSLYTGASAALQTVLTDGGHFAEAILHHNENLALFYITNRIRFHYVVACTKLDTTHTSGAAPHRTNIFLIEVDGLTLA